MVRIREFREGDAPVLWTLSTLPNIGATADSALPLALPAAAQPPPQFADLGTVTESFIAPGGAFLVAEHEGHLVGMGGFQPTPRRRALVLRVRVHPTLRRAGVGRAVMDGLEAGARERGLAEMVLDTAANQPEAVAFYRALGYRESGRETRPDWSWTLIYFSKTLTPASP